MVTLLEFRSGEMPGRALGGVCGGADATSGLGDSSTDGMESGVVSMAVAVSTERLREPPREVRWRFLEEGPLLSSKGLGRPAQGSDEAARSRGGSAAGSPSIWPDRSDEAARRGKIYREGVSGCGGKRWRVDSDGEGGRRES